ncbi:MAG: T9SS type A sorting domain-containing protein [Bacteroidota bacterium]
MITSKHLFLLSYLLPFLLVAQMSYAQHFVKEDSQWIFDYYGGWAYGYTEVFYKKDTLIGDRLCKTFQKHAFRWQGLNNFSFPLQDVYLYEVNGIVEFSTDQIHFDTMMNFQAPIGKSWKMYFDHEWSTEKFLTFTITDTFHTSWNGRELFTQEVEITDPTAPSGTIPFFDTLYEEIGYKYSYILPYDYLNVGADGGEGGSIRCFKNDFLGVAQLSNPYFSPAVGLYNCDQLNSTTPAIDVSPTIAPNPTDGPLHINCEGSRPQTLQLYDLHGRQVDQYILQSNEETLRLDHLPQGIYLLHWPGKGTQKLVKQ